MCQWLMSTSYLYKDFAPLLNDIGLVFQVVFGGLADVYLHALLRQTHTEKTTAKAGYSKTSYIYIETFLNQQRKVKTFGLLDSKMTVHSEFSSLRGMYSKGIKRAQTACFSIYFLFITEEISHTT